MEQQYNSKRKEWIDVLKGILILIVILGHIITNKEVLNYFSSFYMPCFFVLSGWMMKKDGNIMLFIRKRIKGLLLPYCFFALIWILFCFAKSFLVKNDFNLWVALLSVFIPYSGSVGGNVYNLWFFPCLFLSQVIIAILVYGKKIWKIVAITIWIILFILGIFIRPYCSLLYAVAVANIFVLFGFYISNYIITKIGSKSIIWLVCLVILGLTVHSSCFAFNVIYLKNTLDFSAASFGILPIYIIGALGGIVFFIGVISAIKTIKPLSYIGKNSMVYYALHYEVLAVVDFLILKLIDISWVSTLLIFVIVLILTTMISWIYNKLQISKLFR